MGLFSKVIYPSENNIERQSTILTYAGFRAYLDHAKGGALSVNFCKIHDA